jgi:hypothetical protein
MLYPIRLRTKEKRLWKAKVSGLFKMSHEQPVTARLGQNRDYVVTKVVAVSASSSRSEGGCYLHKLPLESKNSKA